MSRFAPVYRALGMILMLFGLTLLAPFGLSYAMDDGATRMFFLMFLLVLSCGCLLWYHYRRGRRELRQKGHPDGGRDVDGIATATATATTTATPAGREVTATAGGAHGAATGIGGAHTPEEL